MSNFTKWSNQLATTRPPLQYAHPPLNFSKTILIGCEINIPSYPYTPPPHLIHLISLCLNTPSHPRVERRLFLGYILATYKKHNKPLRASSTLLPQPGHHPHIVPYCIGTGCLASPAIGMSLSCSSIHFRFVGRQGRVLFLVARAFDSFGRSAPVSIGQQTSHLTGIIEGGKKMWILLQQPL